MIRSANPEVVQPYLKDASNLTGGYAREVVFPEDEKEVVQALDEARRTKTPVTVAGNGTGLVGGRIPFGGIVLSTEKLGGLREIHQTASGGGFSKRPPVPAGPNRTACLYRRQRSNECLRGPHLQIWCYQTVGQTNKGCSFYGGHSGTASRRIRCR